MKVETAARRTYLYMMLELVLRDLRAVCYVPIVAGDLDDSHCDLALVLLIVYGCFEVAIELIEAFQ
jgi:hypothetical protein